MGKWQGAIFLSRHLPPEAVICLFANGTWRASPTKHHTHKQEYLHFHKLDRKKLAYAEKYFQKMEEGEIGQAQEILQKFLK